MLVVVRMAVVQVTIICPSKVLLDRPADMHDKHVCWSVKQPQAYHSSTTDALPKASEQLVSIISINLIRH